MGIRESFQKLIDKKGEEVRDLEIRIREAQAYIQALQDSLRLLPKDDVKPSNSNENATLRDGTTLSKAREILLEAKKPLHITEILTKMGKPIDQATRVSLVGTLGSYSRKGKIFTRTGPNIFGLIEFNEPNLIQTRIGEESEIPLDFGKF